MSRARPNPQDAGGTEAIRAAPPSRRPAVRKHKDIPLVRLAMAVRWLTARLLMSLLVVGLLGLNVATLTIAGVGAVLSGMLEAVDAPTVRSGQAKALRAMRAERDAARSEARRATRQLRQSQQANAKARQKFAAQKNRLDRASRSLMRRTAGGVARNLGSLAGKAVPFAGIAVLAAATIADLSDACAMAGELGEMRAGLDLERDPDGQAATVCGQRVPSGAELTAMVLGEGLSPEQLYARCVKGLGSAEFDGAGWRHCEPLLNSASAGAPEAGANEPPALAVVPQDALSPEAQVPADLPQDDRSPAELHALCAGGLGPWEFDPLGWARCNPLLGPPGGHGPPR